MFAASKTASVSGGYQISRSLRFNSADSAYLNRSLASSGNQQKFTFSYWFKRGTIAAQQVAFGLNSGGNEIFTLAFLSGDTLRVFARNGGTDVLNLTTTAVYRDPSAWYHIVVAIDTTQATSSNRALMYVNGVQVTAFGTATYPAQNTNLVWNNSAYSHQIGREDTGNYLNGYLTETNFIDGQALTPSSFGQTDAQTGVWTPIAYSGSYGTNGFYLNFSDNSNTTAATLGKDYSGNGNNWTPNNFSVTAGAGNDSLVDSPTSYGTDTGVGGEVRGNYSTLNPLSISGTLANGNLDYTGPTGYGIAPSTIGMTSGKWYFEMTATSTGVGCGLSTGSASLTQYLGQNASGWAYFTDGLKYTNNSGSSYGASFTTNDVIGVAFDADAGTLTFYKNGTSQGTAFTSLTSGPYFFTVSDGGSPEQRTCTANFGQRPFAYTAPSGYKALCTQNLPTPTIGATSTTLATKYFNPVLYTGNSTDRSITGVGFQPDFTWIKRRDPADSHYLFDSVRGATKYLSSNVTTAETTNTFSLTSFDSDGFGLGISSTTNSNTNPFVAWNWKANGSGSTNTAGTITSTVSANTTSGFSVVTYTGNGSLNATFGHGLGVVPSMIIVKSRSNANAWPIYHSALGANKYIYLNLTQAPDTVGGLWGASGPSSSLVYLPTSTSQGEVNGSGTTYVAYCFAEVAGYSKFGSYTGNGSTDGPFVFCGFRPAYVLLKSSTEAATNWEVYDNKRSGYNNANDRLYPNLSNAEDSSTRINLFSNGFQLRAGSGSAINSNGQTYIFMAVAENPFKYSLAR